jgi:quercetin dioxygenase-like cupin family protein
MMNAEINATFPSGRIGSCVDMLGSRFELVARMGTAENDAVIFRTSMSAGQNVPIHSHVDPECIYVLSGQLEAFILNGTRGWHAIKVGQSVLFANGVKHAVRNAERQSADLILATNNRFARFLFEAGRPVASGAAFAPPRGEDIERVGRVAREFGYQLTSPAESVAITDQDASGTINSA